jgi:cytochrome bd-type quinol oxidase subunit 2
MGVCYKSISEFFGLFIQDFRKNNSFKFFTISYILTIVILVSYGTSCLLMKQTDDKCLMPFISGLLLIFFAIIMIIFSLIATCMDNSLHVRIRNNPIQTI